MLLWQNPGDANVPLVPGEVKTQMKESRMDPKLSPSNPNIIGFIHHNDVWVSNITTGREKQLTQTHSGLPQNSAVDETVSAGVPSFVVQEEFDRYTGYWWKPMIENDNKFCVLYEEVRKKTLYLLRIRLKYCSCIDHFFPSGFLKQWRKGGLIKSQEGPKQVYSALVW